MTKTIKLLLASVLCMMSLTGCGTQSTPSGDTIEAKTYPFRVQLTSFQNITESEINLYFVNGGDVPYVALSEYMPFVGSIYEDPDLNVPAAEYEITHPAEHHTVVTRTDNSSLMDINTDKDTIEFVGMDYFTSVPGSSLLLSVITLSEDGRGGVSNLLQDTGTSYERSGNSLITFDLSEYMIDLVEKDGECYIPLQTVNDLLVSQNYIFVVFNQQEVIASGYGADLINEMYNAPTGTMSEEFANFNYNELRFMLDCFYGLKPEHDIESFGDFFASTDLLLPLSGTDPVAFDKAIRKLTQKYFDDGHSGLLMNSYLSGKSKPGDIDALLESLEDNGTSSSAMSGDQIRIKSIRENYYPDRPEFEGFSTVSPWLYEEYGDTAIITFDTFAANKQNYYKEADPANPSDTIELISYAHSQITRENSPIKKVVIDLSCNTGGAADAAVFLISWMMTDGAADIALKNTLTGSQSVSSYFADINMDGEFDLDDAIPGELERYCLISPISFSCGNLVPFVLKGAANVTLLGRTSGGGTCVVRPCTTASGTIFAVSSSKQISYVKNGSFYNVDQGVEPDCFINSFDTMYDREKLIDYINDLR